MVAETDEYVSSSPDWTDIDPPAGAWRSVEQRWKPAFAPPVVERRVVGAATQGVLETMLGRAGAAGGGKVIVPAGTEITLSSQLVLPSHVELHLEPGAVLWRDWTSTDGPKHLNATIRGENAEDWDAYQIEGIHTPTSFDDGCAITGSGSILLTPAARSFSDANTDARMSQLYFMACHNFRLEGVTIGAGGRDWALTIHGDDARIIAPRIIGGAQVYEDGIHVMGGSRGRILAPIVESGDDALAFGGHYDLTVDDWVVVAPSVVAQRGHALRILRQREGTTAGFGAFTTHCRNIRVIGLQGSAGLLRNGCINITEDAASPGTLYGIDVDFDLTAGDVGSHDGSNPQGVNINRGQGRIAGTIRNQITSAVKVDGGTWDVRIDAPDKPQTTNAHNIDIDNMTRLTLRGNVKAGAVAAAAVDVTTSTFVRAADLTVTDVLNGQAGVRLNTDGDRFEADVLSIRGAAGATSARGVHPNAAVHIALRSYSSDTDRPLFSAAAAASIRLAASAMSATRTIASGAFTVQGENVVRVLSRTTGSPDTLSTISGGYIGQELEIVNGEAAPTTATITLSTAGNLQLGATRVLNAAGKGVRVRWNGTKWAEVASWV